MAAVMKVFGGMAVLGVVAAADVATIEAEPEMDPAVAGLEAVLAAVGSRVYRLDMLAVRASLSQWSDLGQYFGGQ